MQFAMFSKHLDMLGLSLQEVGKEMKCIGFDGVDLTVRPGGRIEPCDVREKLPEAVDQLGEIGLSVPMITTNITMPNSPYAKETFEACAECGIKSLKLGYWVLSNPKEFWTRFEAARVWLNGIESLALDYDVNANIHIHSGPYLSASAQTVYMLLEDMNPCAVGAYMDSGHMYIEGGRDGWRQGMVMLSPWLNLVALKGYSWGVEQNEDGSYSYAGVMRGFSDAMQDWKQIFTLLIKDFQYDGPISLHSEYGELNREELVAQTQADFDLVKRVIAEISAE